ncbi:hypothetical protein [Actinoplanes sp. TFC3]|uniref:hypothetical protein n=1 Tax=Actinoplanes sp. TFC3 TaxID=1710355 RepID=UPI00082D7664|nr:hypothetical protein [Actinoplanes sp. TFC3]
MRRVPFDPAALEPDEKAWFDDWVRRAHAATARVCADADQGTELRFRQTLWSELKSWLLDHVFHGKCAYCETKMSAQSWGAAEHYRPKSRISVRDLATKKLVAQQNPGGSTSGYYWLAHDWRNIVPACDRCNSGDAKQDQFPIQGTRVWSPAQLNDPADTAELNGVEQPLLLHPCIDEPADHLRFGVAGAIAPKNDSDRGRETIEICRLSRGALAEERQAVQEQVRSAVMMAFVEADLKRVPLKQCLQAVHDKYAEEKAEYSAAGRQAVDDTVAALRRQLSDFAQGAPE